MDGFSYRRASVTLGDAIQHLLTPAIHLRRDARVDAAAADRRRGEGLLAQLVLSNLLISFRRGLEDKSAARLIGGEKLLAHQDERGREAPFEALLPLHL